MSFSASLSGLNANQQKLNVIGNNLANINTIGYKASTVQFTDLVSQMVGGTSVNPMQVGLGVAVGSISPSFRPGGIESTGVSTNVAIQGNGFFVVGDANNRSYSRAGDFSFDDDGMLITPDGQPVQGYMNIDPVTGEVITTGTIGNIVVPPGALRPPVATSQFSTLSNLSANALPGATFTASVEMYDSLGTSHVATITYTNTANGQWNYQIAVPGEEIAGGTPGTPSVIGTGTVGFNGVGKLTTVNGGAAADVNIAGPAWANGATPTALTWDLVDAQGNATLSGFDGASATSSITKNGSPAGSVSSITIDADGRIMATVGTSASIAVGQIALASFNNPQGLTRLGSNRWGATEAAGVANVGVAGTGGRGSLIGSSLEQSNVDIAQEFTQMILAQRGYQANSKSITTADELLLETLNLKR